MDYTTTEVFAKTGRFIQSESGIINIETESDKTKNNIYLVVVACE